MVKYSILIPSYDPEGKRHEMVLRLIESVELNSVGRDYELIIRKNGKSYADSHNDALRSSRGEYIIILNDDTLIQDSEWLEKLTDDNHIVSWQEVEFGLTKEKFWDFSCWSMPRHVFERIGYFDDKFSEALSFEDNDYAYRAKKLGINYKIVPIEMIHYGGGVTGSYYKDKHNLREKGHQIFHEKWIK